MSNVRSTAGQRSSRNAAEAGWLLGACSVAILVLPSATPGTRANYVGAHDPLARERAVAERRAEHQPRGDGNAVRLGPSDARIDARGLHVEAPTGREVTIALARLGRRGAMGAIAPAGRPRVNAAEVHLARAPGVSEWWRSLPSGLEHGVTLDERPRGAGPLRLELAVGSGVRVETTADPDALLLRDAEGGRELARYAGLVVLDSSGARVPARLVAAGERIGIEVDDARARYPLVVDPVLSFVASPEASLVLSACGLVESAPAVSFAGDLVLVGCPSSSMGVSGSGSVMVVSRSGTSWSLAPPILRSGVLDSGLGHHVALSADGSRAVVAASGRVVIYAHTGTTWTEEHAIPWSPAGRVTAASVAMSPDGVRVLVGRVNEARSAEMFVRTGGVWAADPGWPTTSFGMSARVRVAFSPDGTRVIVATDTATGAYVLGASWTLEAPLGSGGADGVALATDRAFVDDVVWVRSGSTWSAVGSVGCTGNGGIHASADGAVAADGRCVFAQAEPGSGTYARLDDDSSGFEWRVPSRDGLRVVSWRRTLPDPPLVIHRLVPAALDGAACGADDQCASGSCRSGVCCGACGVVAGTACAPAAAGLECRSVATGGEGCDPPEVCDGAATSCPPDRVLGDGAACTPPDSCAARGTCVLAGSPDVPPRCVPAGVAAAGTPCRPAVDGCDAAELCDGTSAGCPRDAFLSGVECRASTGACDNPEVCLGTSAACPPDQVASAGLACRVSVDLACDPIESCDGSSTSCPADVNACAPGADASGTDAGTPAPPPAVSGCACTLAGGPTRGGAALGLSVPLFGLALARRRARRER